MKRQRSIRSTESVDPKGNDQYIVAQKRFLKTRLNVSSKQIAVMASLIKNDQMIKADSSEARAIPVTLFGATAIFPNTPWAKDRENACGTSDKP